MVKEIADQHAALVRILCKADGQGTVAGMSLPLIWQHAGGTSPGLKWRNIVKWRSTATRFGWLPAGLHWLTLLLVAAAYASMELRDMYPRGSPPREAMKAWHYVLGISILALTLVRVVVRFVGPVPADLPARTKWQPTMAKWTKAALYCFLLAMPILGWLLLSAEGGRVGFAGMTLPALIGQSPPLAESLEEIHEAGATAGYFVIGLHAAAALYHHYFLRDDTLRRMLPRRR